MVASIDIIDHYIGMQALPTIRQMQLFLALARRRSFSRAAEDCLVSQSTLSSAVKEIETILGAQLVDRSTRSFVLTPAGEETARRAALIVAAAEDLVRILAARRPLEGPFSLGVIPTIAPFVLPRAMVRFKQEYPRLELFLREELTAQLIAGLLVGRLDAALIALPYDAPGIEAFEVGRDPFVFAAGHDHPLIVSAPVTLDALSDAKLLLLEDGHCLRDHAIDACRLQDPGASAYAATSLFTLVQMVQAGLGATLLPQMAVDAGFAAASGLATANLAEPAPARIIGLVARKGSGRLDEVRALAALLRELLGERPVD